MTGKKILEARKLKGLSQEELSEQSKINVRTLQRIENGENVPRGKTLSLLCEALNLEMADFSAQVQQGERKAFMKVMIDALFLVLLNLLMMFVIGILTLDSEANANSRFGGIVVGFFLPFFIVEKTRSMSGTQRMLRFGSGFFIYAAAMAFRGHFSNYLMLGFYPSLIIAMSVLYYGNHLLKPNN